MTFTYKSPGRDYNFVPYLLRIIKRHLLVNLARDKNNFAQWDLYLSTLYEDAPDARDILISGIKNLKYTKIGDTYIIGVNNSVIIPKCKAKLNDICKLINYGNLSIKGYPLFTKTFTQVEHNLDTYITWYLYNI